MGWALGSTYGDVRVCSGRSTSPVCSSQRPELGRDSLGFREGMSHSVLTPQRCSSVLPGTDEELVIGRKRSPFTRNYSSPLEPFHLLSVVTPVGLLSLPSYPTELRPVIVGNDLNLFIHLHKMPCPLGWEHAAGPQQQHPAALVQEQGMLWRR